MKNQLAALVAQFAELRPHIRIDADQHAAAFAVALDQAHQAASEPVPVDPIQVQLEKLTASVTEIRDLMHLEVTSAAEATQQ